MDKVLTSRHHDVICGSKCSRDAEEITGVVGAAAKPPRGCLGRLVDKGNTVIVIEHNLDVIKCADWLIDLGPEGGDGGGEVVSAGTPEDVAAAGDNYTGQYLRPLLNGRL